SATRSTRNTSSCCRRHRRGRPRAITAPCSAIRATTASRCASSSDGLRRRQAKVAKNACLPSSNASISDNTERPSETVLLREVKGVATNRAAILQSPNSGETKPMPGMHEVDYEIHGNDMQYVEVELDPGE